MGADSWNKNIIGHELDLTLFFFSSCVFLPFLCLFPLMFQNQNSSDDSLLPIWYIASAHVPWYRFTYGEEKIPRLILYREKHIGVLYEKWRLPVQISRFRKRKFALGNSFPTPCTLLQYRFYIKTWEWVREMERKRERWRVRERDEEWGREVAGATEVHVHLTFQMSRVIGLDHIL